MTFCRDHRWRVYKESLLSSLKPGGGRDISGAKAGALFNLKNDVAETTDVPTKSPEVIQVMTQKMRRKINLGKLVLMI